MNDSYLGKLADRLEAGCTGEQGWACTAGRIEALQILCPLVMETVGVLRTLATCDDEHEQMTAYLLESLFSTGWRRGGETFWTLDAAIKEGKRLVRRKLARRVRVLPIQVDPNAVADLPISPPLS